jgi:hypothetical protein
LCGARALSGVAARVGTAQPLWMMTFSERCEVAFLICGE